MIFIYLGIVWMNGQGFGFYQIFILIVLFTSATTDRIAQDLRVFYLYLIPDKPLKKLAALMAPSIFAHRRSGVCFVNFLSVCSEVRLGGACAGGLDDDRPGLAVSQRFAGLPALDEKPFHAFHGTDD